MARGKRLGQFSSMVINIVFWLAIILVILLILRMYTTGAIDDIFAPAESVINP